MYPIPLVHCFDPKTVEQQRATGGVDGEAEAAHGAAGEG